jgi:small subunit ribosomal protein S18
MAGKSSGDRRKPLRTIKGGKNAAPAKSIRVGVIDYKDVATLRKFISERGKIRTGAAPHRPRRQERA